MSSEASSVMPISRKDVSAEHTDRLRFHPLLSAVAHLLSVVCHPLFVPVIGTWLVIRTHSFAFAGFDDKSLFRIYGSVASNTVVLTAFTVLILKQLKFIRSIRLPTRQDRVIPYVATMTFYFWAFMVFKHQPQVPVMLTAFLLGNFIAVILAFLSNLVLKISMHALGMGGLLGLACCFIGDPYYNITLPLLVIILVTGAVCTSRLILGEHTLREIYLGVLFGVFAQLLGTWFL